MDCREWADKLLLTSGVAKSSLVSFYQGQKLDPSPDRWKKGGILRENTRIENILELENIWQKLSISGHVTIEGKWKSWCYL